MTYDDYQAKIAELKISSAERKAALEADYRGKLVDSAAIYRRDRATLDAQYRAAEGKRKLHPYG